MRSEKGSIEILFYIIIGAIIIGLIGGVIYWHYLTSYGDVKTLEITVKDKYVKNGSGKSSSSKYLVVDTENNAYEITDLTFLGKWNSTDLYNQLDIGKTYKIQTSGIRNHFWSMYPNINKIDELKDNNEGN